MNSYNNNCLKKEYKSLAFINVVEVCLFEKIKYVVFFYVLDFFDFYTHLIIFIIYCDGCNSPPNPFKFEFEIEWRKVK